MKVVKVLEYKNDATRYYEVPEFTDVKKGDILELGGKGKKPKIGIAETDLFEISEYALHATIGFTPTAVIEGTYRLEQT